MSVRNAVAEIIKVVDADTVHTNLDIGWGVILRPRGRFGGAGTIRIVYPDGKPFDAPERATELGSRALAYVVEEVRPGQRLHVVSHGLDDFSRTLGSVTFQDGRDWATVLTSWGYVK